MSRLIAIKHSHDVILIQH